MTAMNRMPSGYKVNCCEATRESTLGYKQTEVGVIPEEWDVKSLGELTTTVASGRSKSNATYGNYAVHGSTGVIGYSNTSEYKGDAVLVARVGANAGKLNIVSGEYGVTDNTIIVRFGSGSYLPFFWRQMESKNLNSLVFGSGQPLITGTQLKALAVCVPPLPEQLAIATALSDVDALIAAQDKLIAKKRDIKQAAMQQLLTGKQRLPGFDSQNTKFIQTQIGLFPEDWDFVQLLTLVEPSRSIRYGIVQPGEYDPQGRYMIRGQDYSEVKGWANPEDVFRVSSKIEERYRNARVKSGDLIMTIVGYCGHVEMVPDWLDGANLTQTTVRIAIRPDKAVSTFCKYILLSPAGTIQVNLYMKGAAQPGLNCGDIEQFYIPLPSFAEQTAIAAVLSDMDADLAALEQQRDKTRALKQGMMQELLTGRIRLV